MIAAWQMPISESSDVGPYWAMNITFEPSSDPMELPADLHEAGCIGIGAYPSNLRRGTAARLPQRRTI
jgi:hypothetical protein